MSGSVPIPIHVPEKVPVPPSPTEGEYRATVGLFATGITVLTANAVGTEHGMTLNAFASVSLDPLLVLVCVERDAVMHKVLEEAGSFALSVLAEDQEPIARFFADSGRPAGAAQFAGVGYRIGPVTGAPLLEGALAWLECELEQAYGGGDHSIFLGRVLRVERGQPRDPLLYFGGAYRRPGDGRPAA
jgi:flavin reductase (DIM6/NTAB) family NADH-FMN oxidoreductase RutF